MAFKDLFIKPDENSASTVQSSSNQKIVQQPVQVQQTVNMQPQTVAGVQPSVDTFTQNTQPVTNNNSAITVTDAPNDDIVKTLWNHLISSNLPGPDFLELKQNASALANLGLSVEKQYEGAFNVLKAQYPNFSKQVILDSIDTYIGLINNELAEGKKQCEDKRQKTIGDKQTRVEQLNETANNILQQIEDLKKQHSDVLASITNLQNEIASATQELNIQEQQFNNSINVVLNSLNSDKSKIASLSI